MHKEVSAIFCDKCGKVAPREGVVGNDSRDLRDEAADYGWLEIRYQTMYFDACSIQCFKAIAWNFAERVGEK